MSIQKRTRTKKDGSKTVRYYANVWNPNTGKSITGAMRTKRKEAVQDEAKLIQELSAGKYIKTDKKTFGQCASLWFESSKHTFRTSTYKTYLSFYGRYIKDAFESFQIERISALDVQRYTNTLSEKYTPETVNKCINILSDIFQFSIQTLKLLPANENPMIGIKRLKVPYTKKVTWTDEQISLFLNSKIIRSNHYYPMFCISLLLGMRPGEVCGFCDDDLIEDTQTLTFHRTIDKDGNISEAKTQGSIRALYLPDTLYTIVRQSQKRKLQLKSYHPDFQHDFLFTTITGHRVNPNYYSAQFRNALKAYNKQEEIKLPQIPLYNCRHSFATNNYERGESDKVLSDIMGNSPKTFLQTYAHIRRRQSVKAITDYAEKIF